MRSADVAICMMTLSLVLASAKGEESLPENATRRLGELRFRAQMSGKWGKAISRRGKFMAVIPSCDMSLVDVYDLKDGIRTSTLAGSAGVDFSGDMTFSKDESQLLVADGSQFVRGWGIWSRRSTGIIECDKPRSVAMSPDGKTVAICVTSGIDLVAWPSGKRVRLIDADSRGQFEFALFSESGDRLLGCGKYWWSIWRVSDGVRLVNHTQNVNPTGIREMFGFDPKLEYGACLEQNEYGVLVFNASTGITQLSVPIPEGPCKVAILGDTGRIAMTRRNEFLSIEIVDAMTGKIVRTLRGHSEDLFDVKASSDGSTLVGFSATRQWVWDCESGSLRSFCRGHAAISGISFSPDGGIVATTGPSVETRMRAPLRCWDGVRYWDRLSGSLLYEAPNCRFGSFSNDGRSAWTWSHAGELLEVDTRKFREITRSVVVLDNANALKVVDRTTVPDAKPVGLKRWQEWHDPHGSKISAAALYHLSGNINHPEVLVISVDWKDVKTIPRSPPSFEVEDAQIEEIAMSGNGETLAYEYVWYPGASRRTSVGIERSDNRSTIWLGSDEIDVECPVVSSDGKAVLALVVKTVPENDSDSIVEEIRLWSALDGAVIGQWNLKEFNIRQSSASVAISSDRKLFAVGTEDGRVRVWSADRSGSAPFSTLSGHEGAITALAFSVDRRFLATGSADSTVLIFDVKNLLQK